MSQYRGWHGRKYSDWFTLNSAPVLLTIVDMAKSTVRPRPAPQLRLQITGKPVSPSLRALIARRIRRALVGVQTSPIHAHVSFTDVNGPKGGLDVRCAIDVQIPRTAPLHAEALAERDLTAFDQSAAVIARRIAQRLQRRQESERRPKKYYAAKRLL
jgi:ribosome-associated translation inhibitor RaiA